MKEKPSPYQVDLEESLREGWMAEISETTVRTDTPSQSRLVRAGVEGLVTQFFEPLAVDELLRDAWAGATAALLRTGRSEALKSPDFPADPEAAYAVHDQAFPMLEHFADGQLGPDELATAALDELLTRRRDVHTVLLVPRGRFWPFEDDPSSTARWSSRSFGMTLTDTPPLTVVDVLARGPAQRAGVRRGQAVLAINGKPTAHLRRPQAMARLDWRPGAVNVGRRRGPRASASWQSCAQLSASGGRARGLPLTRRTASSDPNFRLTAPGR